MKISLIGLGKMGSVLGQRLLAANFDLTVFNRTTEKMKPLIKTGAIGAKTLGDAVKDAKIIITCLLDDTAVLETVKSIAPLLKPQTIHIGTSTT